jgi:DNA helicase HerA-like ATPase
MRDWSCFQFHQVTELPMPPQAPPPGEPGRQRPHDRSGALAASLAGSHADLLASGVPDAALMVAWVRAPNERRLRVLYGGRPLFPPALSTMDEPHPVLFPPGAMAVARSVTDVARLLGGFGSWVACTAQPDALWAPANGRPEQATIRRGSFDGHVTHLGTPFVWLVVAEPLRPYELEPELATLVSEILPLSRGEVGEAKRITLERKQSRHRELSRAGVSGAWRIRVLVASTSPGSAGTVAAMLCGATELHGLPYVLAPSADPAASFTAGTELLVALARPPEREQPGLRLVQPHRFDVTPEGDGTGGLPLGAVLDEARIEVGPFVLGLGNLNRHTFVCGATGSGKSHTIRHLLAEASRAGLPWLVIEPAKAEYHRMAGEVFVIRPGDPDTAPAGLNPLEPAAGFPLQSHADLLRALFLAAFEAQEPFPQIVAAALTRCYQEAGWDLTLSEPVHKGQRPRYPGLGDLERVAADVVREIGYGKDIADNVGGFIKVRLGSLRLGTAGRLFEDGHPLDFGTLLSRNVVLQIEDVGDDADKAFVMGAVLMRMSEHLRVGSSGGTEQVLRHLTVVEEAHRLLRRPAPGTAGPASHAVEMFAAMLAEVRAYGEGLIIAEQIPALLVQDVIKNTAVKVVHRLPARDDRDSVGATMNVDEDQSQSLVSLVPGEAAAFTDGMDRPVLVRVPAGFTLPGVPTAIDPLIGRRSVTCGASCVDKPCTVREQRTAQRLLDADPWLAVLAELTVLAHLVGRPVPVPRAEVRTAFAARGLAVRSVDCAVSHAVDRAVAVRTAVLDQGTDPSALATHVCGAVGRLLAGQLSGCPDDDPTYLAVPYRWERVRRTLVTTGSAEQVAAAEQMLRLDLSDVARRETVTYGSARPSTLEQVIGVGPQRLAVALAQFTGCPWATVQLGRQETG